MPITVTDEMVRAYFDASAAQAHKVARAKRPSEMDGSITRAGLAAVLAIVERDLTRPGPCPSLLTDGVAFGVPLRCELLAGHAGDHKDGGARWWEADCWHGNACPGGGPDCAPEEEP